MRNWTGLLKVPFLIQHSLFSHNPYFFLGMVSSLVVRICRKLFLLFFFQNLFDLVFLSAHKKSNLVGDFFQNFLTESYGSFLL